MVETEESRKGPWTEQEDAQLVFYVNLFGDRRWDFIAKVSGLKRTGKSCRLRWVNYLHPGLKRGKITPHEERLVLQLHSKWGNRWSRIARKLPGRTDNEIKNYWRTYMRKKAQDEKKKATTSSPSPSSSSSVSNSSSQGSGNSPTVESGITTETKDRSFYDTGGFEFKNTSTTTTTQEEAEKGPKFYSMDEIWKEIELSEEDTINPVYDPTMASPMWDYNYPLSLWNMTDDFNPPPSPISDHQIYSFYNNNNNQDNSFLV